MQLRKPLEVGSQTTTNSIHSGILLPVTAVRQKTMSVKASINKVKTTYLAKDSGYFDLLPFYRASSSVCFLCLIFTPEALHGVTQIPKSVSIISVSITAKGTSWDGAGDISLGIMRETKKVCFGGACLTPESNDITHQTNICSLDLKIQSSLIRWKLQWNQHLDSSTL